MGADPGGCADPRDGGRREQARGSRWGVLLSLEVKVTPNETGTLDQVALLLRIIVIAIGLAFCFVASSLCITIVLSALLALIIDPVVVGLEKVGLGRTLSAGLAIACLVLIMGVLTYGLYRKAGRVADQLPTYSYRIQRMLLPLTDRVERLQKGAESLKSATSAPEQEIKVTEAPPSWPSYLIRGAGSISGMAAIAGISPFLAFFMLIRKDQMRVRFVNIFDGRVDTAIFIAKVKAMVRGYVLGNLIVGVVLSGLTVAVFLALGLRGAVALGLVCGFFNIIPFIGGFLAALTALAATLLQFDSVRPLVVVALAIFALHLIAVNYLIPRLVGLRLLIGPVASTIGMLFWGWLWGAMGVLLAVPLTAFIKLIADTHPRLVHLSNLLAHEPKPVRRWILVGETIPRPAGPGAPVAPHMGEPPGPELTPEP